MSSRNLGQVLKLIATVRISVRTRQESTSTDRSIRLNLLLLEIKTNKTFSTQEVSQSSHLTPVRTSLHKRSFQKKLNTY